MIIILALLFRLWLRKEIVVAAREQADKGIAGSMEGHAAMDMSVQGEGSAWRRLFSGAGFTSTSTFFVMDWAAVWKDIVGGLLIAGAFAAWVPMMWLQDFFLTDNPILSKIWGPIVGPFVAMISFVCSVGNVPLAAVLWNGGISFGGVISFIFADLIIIPILLIYRRYYGTKMMIRIFICFYIAMAGAGYIIEILFGLLGIIPTERNATITDGVISWNYTTYLNILFLLIAAAFIWRFFTTGGMAMLRMMGGSPEMADEPSHDH